MKWNSRFVEVHVEDRLVGLGPAEKGRAKLWLCLGRVSAHGTWGASGGFLERPGLFRFVCRTSPAELAGGLSLSQRVHGPCQAMGDC